MLGPPKPCRLAEPIAVSLEQLVLAYHFYRHLEAKLDLSFVRDLVLEAYAETGRPSIDQVIFFKLQLVMFFERLRSERHPMQMVANWLSLRWYLGYDLSEPLPTTPASPGSGSATDRRPSTASSRRSSSNASPGWSGARNSISTRPRSRPMPRLIRWPLASLTRRALDRSSPRRRCLRA
jgi:hypothetical protein